MSTWKTPFGFNFFVDDIYHHVCFDKSEQQERWITGLTTAGAHFSEVILCFHKKIKVLCLFSFIHYLLLLLAFSYFSC